MNSISFFFHYFFFNVLKTYLKDTRDKYLKKGVLKSIVDVTKAKFQIYRAYPDGVISKS